MTESKIYEKFIEWLKTAPGSFPDSGDMTALIKARYTPEDAALLTNIPFGPRTIEELAEIKQMAVEDLKPRLDALAKKGVVWKIFTYGKYRYRFSRVLPFSILGRRQKFRALCNGAFA
ncbi:MAG: hypothetical protein JRJ73_15080 [Deltaproteobacteria bacterium]|nr:hypothetical protein [Deltaproteobacteria bacterium]